MESLLSFTSAHCIEIRSHAIAKAQKARQQYYTPTPHTHSSFNIKTSTLLPLSPLAEPTHPNLSIMTTKSCANCNAATTESHPLKICGDCKTVAYCDRAGQKANWKAHKSFCRLSEGKKQKSKPPWKRMKSFWKSRCSQTASYN